MAGMKRMLVLNTRTHPIKSIALESMNHRPFMDMDANSCLERETTMYHEGSAHPDYENAMD